MPPREHFETGELPRYQVHLGLVEGNEFALGDRVADLVFQASALQQLLLHSIVEPDLAIPSGALGGVHRDVRSSQALLGSHSGFDARDADRGGHVGRSRAQHDRLRDRFKDALHGSRNGLIGLLRDDDRELIASEPRAKRAFRDQIANGGRGPLEDFVPDDVPVQVVDLLEEVEIEQEEPAAAAVGAGFGENPH